MRPPCEVLCARAELVKDLLSSSEIKSHLLRDAALLDPRGTLS